MIDTRGQEYAVFAVEALFIGGIPPWLAVAGQEMTQIIDTGNTTAAFNSHNALLK
jgi:hypothetical protein